MIYVNSIKLNKSSLTLKLGETYEDMEATVSPSNTTNQKLLWCSDNSAIASVNENSGRIFANSVGTTTIYACSTDGSRECDCCTVTVANTVPVEKVTINMPDFVMQLGKSKELKATVSPVNATNKSIIWRSSNENILKVVDGTVCALNVGTATITARSADNNSIETYCNIRVTENVIVESIYINEEDIVLRPNGSTYLHECVLPSNAANPKVVWSSSDTSVATVNPESGFVMAQGEGTAKIYATAADGGRAQTYIYVTVEPIIPVESVTVNPTDLKLAVGESKYIAKTVWPRDATDQRVTWCSSNPNVACVDCYSGRVTANKVGTAVITVTTVDGGYSASCELSVKKTYSQRDYEIMSIEDKALMSCLQLIYAYYENIGDNSSVLRQDEILRKMQEIRLKEQYIDQYYNCVDPNLLSSDLKTTKIEIQELKALTKEDIMGMHNSDSIIIALANLIPGIGTGFSILMETVRNIEQTGNIQFLGMTKSILQSYLLKDYLWLDTILSTYETAEEIMDTTGKDTYVKDGFRIAEGDVAVKIRLDYNLGCTNTVFDIIVRNNIPVSIQIYGGRIDIPVDGYYNSTFVEDLKRKWRDEGYVSDAYY